jgi:hypothetical protein
VPPHDATEEKMELALVADDAEFQPDPERSPSDGRITAVGAQKRRQA